MPPTGNMSLMVKMAPLPKKRPLALTVNNEKLSFTAEPLLPNLESRKRLGMAQAPRWHLVHTQVDNETTTPWDVCHQLLGHKDAAVEFAEPDLAQRWVYGRDADLALAMTRDCEPAPPNANYPHQQDAYWFGHEDFSQLARAAEAVGEAPAKDRIRIAHLDTGYDPGHQSLPLHLRPDLARNFVDADRSNEAHDKNAQDPMLGSSLLNSPGHGVGTLGILAGQKPGGGFYGGAPFQDIAPIRVADSVVLFKNSAIARALDYVFSLWDDPATRVHVVSMSMGGVASRAWAEAVNALYEQGVVVVCAAGNNFGNLPTHHLVYPARFGRVLAACGIMADNEPYADLGITRMAGNYGPASRMGTALAAYTPSTPWARLNCPGTIDQDGAGTSSATPQIAAAAALWLQKHHKQVNKYPAGWMRVEAVRKALFDSARKLESGNVDKLGRGVLRALESLKIAPAKAAELTKTPSDQVRFPLLGILFGIRRTRRDMIELEGLQLALSSREMERLLPDPQADPRQVSAKEREQVLETLRQIPGASRELLRCLDSALDFNGVPATPHDEPRASRLSREMEQALLHRAMDPPVSDPSFRCLRVYTFDPHPVTRLETREISRTELEIPWEANLEPGPVGEYLEVIDYDPASGCCYAPVDLNHPSILAQRGVAPSVSNPQFHQQMVYAWIMKTIDIFETALGRKALWSPRIFQQNGKTQSAYVQRLRVHPHGLREPNAYYSPHKKALLFGYFARPQTAKGDAPPGGMVFSCLSHDIVAHETSHALLDGLHRYFSENTGPDCLAFHEAFADIVALFQHFMLPDALIHQIKQTRGDLGNDNLLPTLAVEFGLGTGTYGGLRNFIGTFEGDAFKPAKPSTQDYEKHTEAHDRGAVLVSAVFEAFLQVFRKRGQDLIRLATAGTGVLPEGDISHDLAHRLAQEASTTAGHILNICIRALDYCPPVNILFGDYLRALITADRDLVPDDKLGYRVAFIDAFRKRGIYPTDVRTLAEESLTWHPPRFAFPLEGILPKLNLNWDLFTERETAYELSRDNARKLHAWLADKANLSDDQAREFGFAHEADPDHVIKVKGRELAGNLHGFEVHSVRPARRTGRNGEHLTDIVVEITQKWVHQDSIFRGGCTWIIDPGTNAIRYSVRMRVGSPERIAGQMRHQEEHRAASLTGAYFDESANTAANLRRRECFAALHRKY